jgi:hypothetical protein
MPETLRANLVYSALWKSKRKKSQIPAKNGASDPGEYVEQSPDRQQEETVSDSPKRKRYHPGVQTASPHQSDNPGDPW